MGAHFFSPAHIMPLLEIVRTEHTSKQVGGGLHWVWLELGVACTECSLSWKEASGVGACGHKQPAGIGVTHNLHTGMRVCACRCAWQV